MSSLLTNATRRHKHERRLEGRVQGDGVLSWGKETEKEAGQCRASGADTLGSHISGRDRHLSREQALQSWVNSSAQGDPELVLVALHSPLHSAAPETSVPIESSVNPKPTFTSVPSPIS